MPMKNSCSHSWIGLDSCLAFLDTGIQMITYGIPLWRLNRVIVHYYRHFVKRKDWTNSFLVEGKLPYRILDFDIGTQRGWDFSRDKRVWSRKSFGTTAHLTVPASQLGFFSSNRKFLEDFASPDLVSLLSLYFRSFMNPKRHKYPFYNSLSKEVSQHRFQHFSFKNCSTLGRWLGW